MYVDEQDHRRRLRTVVEEVIADTDVHEGLSFFILCRTLLSRVHCAIVAAVLLG
jgi:hypothetical protein